MHCTALAHDVIIVRVRNRVAAQTSRLANRYFVAVLFRRFKVALKRRAEVEKRFRFMCELSIISASRNA
jgi:hypothetical protein